MARRNWKQFGGVAARRIDGEIRSSINPGGEITFDLATFKKLGEPQAMFLYYEESTRTIALKGAHPDAHNAVLVRIRHARSNRVVRSRPFLRENGIEVERTQRFPFPYTEDEMLILDLRTAVTCGKGGWKKVRKSATSVRKAERASVNHLKRTVNPFGTEIFVESEDRNGKPMIWYSFDSKGRKQKHVRDANGVRVSRDEE